MRGIRLAVAARKGHGTHLSQNQGDAFVYYVKLKEQLLEAVATCALLPQSPATTGDLGCSFDSISTCNTAQDRVQA